MNREEILAKSREENKDHDPAELVAVERGQQIAWGIMLLMCCIFFAAEIMIKGHQNWGLFGIVGVNSSIMFGVKAYRLRTRKDTLMSILWGLLAIAAIVSYFMDLFASSAII